MYLCVCWGMGKGFGVLSFFIPRTTPPFSSQHLDKRILRVVDRGLENLSSNTNFFLTYYKIFLSLRLSFLFVYLLLLLFFFPQ